MVSSRNCDGDYSAVGGRVGAKEEQVLTKNRLRACSAQPLSGAWPSRSHVLCSTLAFIAAASLI